MRCNICDRELSETEVQWSNLHQVWDPCSTCLTVIAETFGEEGDEEETEVEEYDDEVCYENLFPLEINDLE